MLWIIGPIALLILIALLALWLQVWAHKHPNS
jgi:hypothetical protein